VDTHIWYFAEAGKGIVVQNVSHFNVYDDAIVVYMMNGRQVPISKKKDVEGFKERILGIREEEAFSSDTVIGPGPWQDGPDPDTLFEDE
jgi:hypothetical protein